MRIELALLQQNMSLRNRERVYFAFWKAEYAFFDFFGRRQIEAKENGILWKLSVRHLASDGYELLLVFDMQNFTE